MGRDRIFFEDLEDNGFLFNQDEFSFDPSLELKKSLSLPDHIDNFVYLAERLN